MIQDENLIRSKFMQTHGVVLPVLIADSDAVALELSLVDTGGAIENSPLVA